MKKDYKKTVQIFKALADETRLKIIDMLSNGELCACKILENFNITQPTLSYHMKILTDCGLVRARRDGAWMQYSLNCNTFESVKEVCFNFCENIHQCASTQQCDKC